MSTFIIVSCTIVIFIITMVTLVAIFNMWRMDREIRMRHDYVKFEAMREEMLYRDREQKVSKDRVEGLCKEYEETFRAMQIMDELEGRQ